MRPGCRPTSLEGARAPRAVRSGARCASRRDRLLKAFAAFGNGCNGRRSVNGDTAMKTLDLAKD